MPPPSPLDDAPAPPKATVPRLCLVTPTYAPELPLFRRLSESIDRFAAPDMEHLVIVSRKDAPLFRPWLNGRARLILKEDILDGVFRQVPSWLNPLPSRRELWVSRRTRPVRGWIMQQIFKIGAARYTNADGLLFVDSDTALVKPLTADRLMVDGRLRLFTERAVCRGLASHHRWDALARRLLGLPPKPYDGDNYVGPFVTWNRRCVLKLMEHLADQAKAPWWTPCCTNASFSEYHVYGLFVEEVLGLDAAGHHLCDAKLSLSSWDFDLFRDEQVDAFVQALTPQHIGFVIQSNIHLPEARQNAIIDRLQAQGRLLHGPGTTES